jgi:hypothetical protein
MKNIFNTTPKQIVIYLSLLLLTYSGLVIFIMNYFGYFNKDHKESEIDLSNLFTFIEIIINASKIYILIWMTLLIVLIKRNIISSFSFKILTSFLLLFLLWIILSEYKVIP